MPRALDRHEEIPMRNPFNFLAALSCSVFLSGVAIAEGLPAKAAGVTRIGIVQPKVAMAGADSAQSAEAPLAEGAAEAVGAAIGGG
jgi:hypothetical protein